MSHIDRISPTRRPDRSPSGFHVWSDLTFLHWTVPAELIQRTLPKGLTVDTWDGQAYVGLVPFRMSGVRPWWSPAMPWISAFPETNVRTYVHREGRDPGVWFYSLEAARWLAVKLARWGWHLPYHWARMSVRKQGQRLSYASQRLGLTLTSKVVVDVEGGVPLNAAPGTFEHFLVERYLLYAQAPSGMLYRGQVHHTPYPLQSIQVREVQDELVGAAGFPVHGPPVHAIYSPGVKVEVFSLEKLSTSTNTRAQT